MADSSPSDGEKHASDVKPSLPPYALAGSGSDLGVAAVRPQARDPYDPNVTFEEYAYYARRTREEERGLPAPSLQWLKLMFGKRALANDDTAGRAVEPSAFHEEKLRRPSERAQISDEEWTNASRAFRTAGWGACFYLITTDVLGPFGIGFAMGTLGWAPGIVIFTVFGVMAGYSGYLIWRIFLGIDSYEFPARNYGDLAFRTWGTTARHATNFLQALGLLLLLGQVTLQYGENISAVSKFRLCYAVCPVLFVCVGFFLTQIRTLKNYGIIANLSVWLTLLTIFISMGVIANSNPYYAISKLGSAGSAVDPSTIKPVDGVYPAIIHYNGLPPGGLVGSINGILSGVLAYAGAQLFVEFLAEMRRPRDFIKAMWGAQFFIYTVYLVYGCFVYYYQGQYSFNPSYQGVSVYAWATVNNMITLISALIAAGLYGNIGIKVFYNNVLMDIFKAPPLVTRSGKIIYACVVPVWWAISFVIAAAIPDYFGFVSVISASTLLNLTYTLPPFFALGYDIKVNAMRAGVLKEFDPAAAALTSTKFALKDWARGFWRGGVFQVGMNVWHVLYILASLSMCGLGMYAAVEGLIEVFAANEGLNAFSCTSPLNLDG